MTIIVVERATPGLRGQLTRWMLEVRAGVFVGTLSARVRDKLWALVKARNPRGGSVLIVHAHNEQGFDLATHGDPSRQIFENEGLLLVKRPPVGTPRGRSRSPETLPARRTR